MFYKSVLIRRGRGSGRAYSLSVEKEMATHSSNLAWRTPWSLAGYSLWGHKKSDTTEQLTTHTHTHTHTLSGHMQRKGSVRTQQEGHHLPAKRRGLTRDEIYQTVEFELWNYKKIIFI